MDIESPKNVQYKIENSISFLLTQVAEIKYSLLPQLVLI